MTSIDPTLIETIISFIKDDMQYFAVALFPVFTIIIVIYLAFRTYRQITR